MPIECSYRVYCQDCKRYLKRPDVMPINLNRVDYVVADEAAATEYTDWATAAGDARRYFLTDGAQCRDCWADGLSPSL